MSDRRACRHLRSLPLLSGLLTCLAVTSSPCQAEVYKWVDEQGVVHYSDQEPRGKASRQLDIPLHSPETSAAQEPPTKLQEQVEQLNRQQEVETMRERQESEEAALKKTQQARCDKARQNLETISQRARIQVEEPDGSLRYLTPEEIVEQKERAESVAQEACSDSGA